MSHWEYRIGFKRHSFSVIDDVTHEPTGDVAEEITYGLIEAYYNDKGDLWLTTERFIEPSGETKEELIENLEMMLKDAKKDTPVLDLEKLWKELEMKELENELVENKL